MATPETPTINAAGQAATVADVNIRTVTGAADQLDTSSAVLGAKFTDFAFGQRADQTCLFTFSFSAVAFTEGIAAELAATTVLRRWGIVGTAGGQISDSPAIWLEVPARNFWACRFNFTTAPGVFATNGVWAAVNGRYHS